MTSHSNEVNAKVCVEKIGEPNAGLGVIYDFCGFIYKKLTIIYK